MSGLRLGQLFQQFLACLLHFNTATSCTVPFKPNCRLKMLGPAPFCQCYVTFLNYLQVWLLLAAVCNGLIQVDRLPNANQILAEQPQQQPRNSNESFKGVDYETRKYFGMNWNPLVCRILSFCTNANATNCTDFLDESLHDRAIVRFINLDAPIDANLTGSSTLECWVIHPIIIAEQVYLQIFMKDNSSMMLTGGRAKPESQRQGYPRNKDDWWQGEEYQFDINFNVNMSRAACLGMDHNGTWRHNEDTIEFECMSPPRVLLETNEFTSAFEL